MSPHTDSSQEASAWRLLAVLAAVVLCMRGPITMVGPAAADLMAFVRIDYAAYGIISSLPVLCFGLFCAFAVPLTQRIGMNAASACALGLVTLGSVARLAPSLPALTAGTVAIGAGIALLNAIVPVLVRSRFPDRVGLMMGVFTGLIGLSGAIGAYCCVPLIRLTGSITSAFALWGILGCVALAAWLIERPGSTVPTAGRGPRLSGLLWRPALWAVTLVMGLQSLTIYTTVAWVPTFLMADGMPQTQAALAVALFLLCGVPASIGTAWFMARLGSAQRAAAVIGAAFALGIVLWQGAGLWPFAGSVLAGLAQGAMFSFALILFSTQSASLGQMMVLSGWSQSVGYLLAALGPIVCAQLFALSGSWAGSGAFLTGVVVLWALAGWYGAGRARVFTASDSL